jgi:hypothetical protein
MGLKQLVKNGTVSASVALRSLEAQGEIARQSKTFAWLNCYWQRKVFYIVQTRIADKWLDYETYRKHEHAFACFSFLHGETRIVRNDGIELAIKY